MNNCINTLSTWIYRGADKSLARPTSRCTLFDGENISFDASLVMYINSTNIVAYFLPGLAKDLSAPLSVLIALVLKHI